MLRLLLLYGLCSVQIFGVQALFENFIYLDSTPKCCMQDEILSFNDSSGEAACIKDYDKNLQIFGHGQLRNLSEGDFCVDSIAVKENETDNTIIGKLDIKNSTLEHFNLTPIPKCCPYHTVYDIKNHKCIAIFNESSFFSNHSFVEAGLNQLFAIKAGLSNCQHVIGDYEVSTLKRTNFDYTNSLFVTNLATTIPYGNYCIDKLFNSDKLVVRVCHKDFSICKQNSVDDRNKIRCIRKCCDDGKIYRNGPHCDFDFEHGLNFENDSKVVNWEQPFATIQGHNCKKYLVDSDWEYTLDNMGNVDIEIESLPNSNNSPFEQTYCFENLEINSVQTRRLFLCFKYFDRNKVEYQVSEITLILSCIFLVLTLIGYAILPEMRNLHGRIMMAHCTSMLVAFLLLVVARYFLLVGIPCRVLGYSIMYCFLIAFMWSNIMCFDIWWTFGSLKNQAVNEKKKELKRFICYCACSLLIPALIITAAATIQYIGENYPHTFPDTFKAFIPTMGRFNCFFEQGSNTLAFLVWFVIPLAIITICNFVLYIKTIVYYYQVKRQINKMQAKNVGRNEKKNCITADLEKLTLAIKLFLVMGISWLFESISVCVIPVPATGILLGVEMFFDAVNGLQGVFIFLIFILKGKFLKVINKKLGRKYQFMKKSSRSFISSPSTSTYVSYVNKPQVENNQ